MSIHTYKKWTIVTVYSIAHFLVDFACIFLMFHRIAGTPNWYLCVLLYNFCAFAMQMPLGILADKWNRNFIVAIIGCALVGLAYVFWQFPIAATCIAGIGNALFHLGGGIDVLNISEEKSGALGVFVSPGAFGVYLGTVLGKENAPITMPILLALLLAIVMIFTMRRVQGEAYPKNAEFSLDTASPIYYAVACLFVVVCLRSYVGLTLSFPWKSISHWGAALVCAVVFGKTIGGFFADRFGLIKTSCVSLGIASILFLFPQIPAAGIISVLLFNMTMPITLWAMAKIFPGAKGFSFGLLTFGLFIGFLPVHFGMSDLGAPWLYAFAAILSLVLLLTGLRKADI